MEKPKKFHIFTLLQYCSDDANENKIQSKLKVNTLETRKHCNYDWSNDEMLTNQPLLSQVSPS
jgi:hypothetical protein